MFIPEDLPSTIIRKSFATRYGSIPWASDSTCRYYVRIIESHRILMAKITRKDYRRFEMVEDPALTLNELNICLFDKLLILIKY